MRFHVRPSRRRLDRITLNLASMIDVTFLLLIYFMVTTVLVTPEDELTSAIQTRSDSGETSDFQTQMIDVVMADGRPVYRLGERTMHDRAALFEVLRTLPTAEGIVINVSDSVPVGFAVTALQVAHDSGFEQVTYVPQP